MGILLAGTLLHQVLTMFALVAVGYLMARFGKLAGEGSKALGNVLLYLSLPCVIIRGFQVERTPENLYHLLLSALLAALILALSILISRGLARGDAIFSFAAAFGNPGFFGIPLLTACFRESSVFYIAAFLALLNLCQWTYGVSLLVGGKVRVTLKQVLTAPFMVAIVIGLFFFLTGLPVPALLNQCMGYMAGLNTPLAMFTIGIYLTKVDFFRMFRRAELYLISAVRLLLVPLAAILLLTLVPHCPVEMRYAILIASACPVGSNIAVYADLHNRDYPYSVQAVIISTLLSVVTIPLVVLLASQLWGL